MSWAWKIAPASRDVPKVTINYIDETLGTDATMEYSGSPEGPWSPCAEDMLASAAGWDGSETTVYIRYAEDSTVTPKNGPKMTLPDGGIVDKNGNVTLPNGGSVEIGDATVTLPQGGTIRPNGNGSVQLPAGAVVKRAGKNDVTVPDCGAVYDPATDTLTFGIHRVTFNSQGGSKVTSAKVIHGEKAAKPADPTRSGYTFGGWYTDAACTTAYDFSSEVTSDLTLYAKWTASSSDSSDSTSSSDSTISSSSLPRTGDTSNLRLWAPLLAISFCGIAVVLLVIRKLKGNNRKN